MPALILAHAGQPTVHDLVLLGLMVVAPVVLLGIVIVVGRLRGEGGDAEEDEAT